MPVCRCKNQPISGCRHWCRTVKVSIHTRIGLIKDADKIIAMDNPLLAVRDINHKYIVVATCKEKAVCYLRYPLWLALLLISSGTAVGVTVYEKQKKGRVL